MLTSGFCSWLRNVALGYLRANLKIIIHFVYLRLYCSPEAIFCLPSSQRASKEIYCSLKNLADFSSSHSELIRAFGPESTIDWSFRYRRSSSRVRRGILSTSKGNRQLCCEVWSRKQQKYRDITPFSSILAPVRQSIIDHLLSAQDSCIGGLLLNSLSFLRKICAKDNATILRVKKN